MCATCYSRLKKEGRLPPLKKETGVQKKKQETEAECVLIDFSPAPHLLEELKRRADEEMRPMEMQILWELKRAMCMETPKVG